MLQKDDISNEVSCESSKHAIGTIACFERVLSVPEPKEKEKEGFKYHFACNYRRSGGFSILPSLIIVKG